MIDPHVHLRDWNQSEKETVKHGLMVAYKAGLNAVFEMPNTDPALTYKDKILERLKLGEDAIKEMGIDIFHGIYAGLTADRLQIKEVCKAHQELFPRVVGLKMFAGQSTGNMGIIAEEDQRKVYRELVENGFEGVLAVHCEKESLMDAAKFDPKDAFTHTIARPPEAELESVRDQIKFAKEAGFKGTLHICHLSNPECLNLVLGEKELKVTCGVTPHHAVLYDEMMRGEKGMLLKMNPALRPKNMADELVKAILSGKVNWIETDHAPHTLKDKTEKFASGIPGLPYYPVFVEKLREKGADDGLIKEICHTNICKAFGIDIVDDRRRADLHLEEQHQFDAFSDVK